MSQTEERRPADNEAAHKTPGEDVNGSVAQPTDAAPSDQGAGVQVATSATPEQQTFVARDGGRRVLPPGYVIGADRKLYPYHPLDEATRGVIVGKVHRLSHAGLSVRQIVARLAEDGFRVSVGTVHGWLKTWRCNDCSGGSIRPPEHSTVERAR